MLSFLIFTLCFAAGFILGLTRAKKIRHVLDHYHFHDQQITVKIELRDGDAESGEEWKR